MKLNKLGRDTLSRSIEEVWSGRSRRIDLSYTLLGKSVTVRIYQTIPGLLRVDIREEKTDRKLDAFRD